MIHGVPAVDAAVDRWTDDYLRANMLGAYSVEKSKDNHFMYFSGAVS